RRLRRIGLPHRPAHRHLPRRPRHRLRPLPQRPHRLDLTPDELTGRTTKRCGSRRPRPGQQSFWVVMAVATVVMGELAAWVVAVWAGRAGAVARSWGLVACSDAAGWTSPQVPASPELSVLTA